MYVRTSTCFDLRLRFDVVDEVEVSIQCRERYQRTIAVHEGIAVTMGADVRHMVLREAVIFVEI